MSEPSQRAKDLALQIYGDPYGAVAVLIQAALDAERAEALRDVIRLLKERLKRGDNMADMRLESLDTIKFIEAEADKLQSQ